MSKFPKLFESPFQSYSVVKCIGEGGAGRVFQVKTPQGEVFALKCLVPERVTTERVKRFKNEVDFSQRCDHPNVVRVHDVGAVAINNTRCPFYVMRLYTGTLRESIEAGLAPAESMRMYSKLLDGVEAAHLNGVWHRDLKPENVLVNAAAAELVVADFGIAHFEDFSAATKVGTRVNAKLANLQYSAPEQRSRGAAVDHRADIFALGLILNELFTGEVPHGRGHRMIVDAAPDHAYLDAIVESMLQQEPERRPKSIADVKKILIGRGKEFAALQVLDAKSRQVVPAFTPGTVAPVEIIGADVDGGTLRLTLDRKPEDGWVQAFQNPSGNFEHLIGYAPLNYSFRENVAQIGGVTESIAQQLVDQFKRFSRSATGQYQARLTREAATLKAREDEKLRDELRQAEQRVRILGALKI